MLLPGADALQRKLGQITGRRLQALGVVSFLAGYALMWATAAGPLRLVVAAVLAYGGVIVWEVGGDRAGAAKDLATYAADRMPKVMAAFRGRAVAGSSPFTLFGRFRDHPAEIACAPRQYLVTLGVESAMGVHWRATFDERGQNWDVAAVDPLVGECLSREVAAAMAAAVIEASPGRVLPGATVLYRASHECADASHADSQISYSADADGDFWSRITHADMERHLRLLAKLADINERVNVGSMPEDQPRKRRFGAADCAFAAVLVISIGFMVALVVLKYGYGIELFEPVPEHLR